MTISKKPSKETSLPSQDETPRANVLREEMLSQFRTFGESLSIIREDVSGIKPRLDKIEQMVDVLESAVRTHSIIIRDNTDAICSLNEKMENNTAAIHSMQADLKSINHRVEIVETKLAS